MKPPIEFPEEQKVLEIARKTFHALVGIGTMVLFVLFGRFWLALFLCGMLALGVAVSEWSLRGRRIPLFTALMLLFDRPEDIRLRPGFGVFTILGGFLLVLVFPYLPGVSLLAAHVPQVCRGLFFGAIVPCSRLDPWGVVTLSGMLAATFSDTLSTVGGVYFGKHRWPHNRRKSLEGSLFNLAGAVGAVSLVAPVRVALVVALVVMVVESLPHVDDNLNIPVAGTAATGALFALGFAG
ncbi:MAG: hypothetical protein HY558_04710 [Euryarchaeota archaeon]|nr:hypothetical protein [Euryarchaeota archaeon]